MDAKQEIAFLREIVPKTESHREQLDDMISTTNTRIIKIKLEIEKRIDAMIATTNTRIVKIKFEIEKTERSAKESTE